MVSLGYCSISQLSSWPKALDTQYVFSGLGFTDTNIYRLEKCSRRVISVQFQDLKFLFSILSLNKCIQ